MKDGIRYIDNLTFRNYKEHIPVVLSSVALVMSLMEVNITELSDLVGLSRVTLYRYLNSDNKKKIRFKTLAVFNNFVGRYLISLHSDMNLTDESEIDEFDADELDTDDFEITLN